MGLTFAAVLMQNLKDLSFFALLSKSCLTQHSEASKTFCTITVDLVYFATLVPGTSDTSTTQATLMRHMCNTDNTSATRVKNECDTSVTGTTRVLEERQECDTSKSF